MILVYNCQPPQKQGITLRETDKNEDISDACQYSILPQAKL
jgi:hypothetical protein